MVTDARIPVARFVDSAHLSQVAAFRAFDEGRARFAHLIWHRRARKTSLAINLLIREALRHQNHTYRHILPQRTQAEEVVWNDPKMLFSFLPQPELGLWRATVSNLTITFKNGSRYVLDGADKIADKRRGIGGDGFVLDEWDFHATPYVYTGLIRPVLSEGEGRWCWFLTTFNGVRHALEMYEKALAARRPDTYCHMLKASESGILSQSELDDAKEDMPYALYMQEYECEPMSTADMVLIQPQDIARLASINHGFINKRRIISCDPALGGDECIIMAIENTAVLEKQSHHPRTPSEIVGLCLAMGTRWDTNNYIADKIGLGEGVVDGLSQIDGTNVQGFVSSAKALYTRVQMANLRAEAWWYVAMEIRHGRVAPITDRELIRQLCSVTYSLPNGRVQIEDKSRVRARLGRSPDDADCYVIGQYGLKNVDPERQNGSRFGGQRIFVPAGAGMGGMA